MNYAALYREDYSNGEGRRVTLFVTGCLHNCAGCHNKPAQNPRDGEPFTEYTLESILSYLRDADGLTLTGGDPLYPRNRKAVTELLRAVKGKYPEKDVWMWTGYEYKDVASDPIMEYLDVLVDGKYEKSLPSAPWRGSNNQQIIRVKEI